MSMEIVCPLWLTESQAYHYPAPVARHPLVSKMWLVRSHRSPYGDVPGAEYVLTPGALPLRLLRMYGHCRRLAAREAVRGFVSFNPFPYGMLALKAALKAGKPVHFGFIGTDWYTHMKGVLRPLLLKYVRRASFVTVTGEQMRGEMIEAGIDGGKIAVLPHCIDVERYPVADADAADYTCIFVGKLERRKRVDVILRAFARVVERHSEARLCIVGDGPLMDELCRLRDELKIADAVDFVGYRDDVAAYLARARINVMASTEEGFPFSLVEGICCGLVPVTTPVGTIADLIETGRNGFLFDQEDDETMAAQICGLLEDPARLAAVREEVLGMRDGFSYESATAVWDPWIRSLASSEDGSAGGFALPESDAGRARRLAEPGETSATS
jgi:glycosyltransferase involved in cell wall biosynthesis